MFITLLAVTTVHLLLVPATRGFSPPLPRFSVHRTSASLAISQHPRALHSKKERNQDDDDEIDVSNQDWRAFRAKLVMQKEQQQQFSGEDSDDDLDGIGSLFSMPQTTAMTSTTSLQLQDTMTPLDPSQWAYDSGKLIEQGAVILGGVEQEFGFGLAQQYFHKAAILVLDHDDRKFTKGIILNRPSDLTLEDDINDGVQWRVWFGGDVQGLNTDNPDIVCLHSLKGELVRNASVTVMNDIQWTSFDNAKRLVKAGAASPNDFWVFCGYAGWGPNQLMGELDRKSWYMVATDSQTLLTELSRQTAGADPRDAGLDTWTLLMNMIGKKDTAEEYSGEFDDLVLKEWALRHLLSTAAGGGAGKSKVSPKGITATQGPLTMATVDQLLTKAAASARGQSVAEGTLVRASSQARSPFLLEKQEMHKSLVLIINDDENTSVGVILNRPSSKGVDIHIVDKPTQERRTVVIPIRYGGQFAVKGAEPLLWLHGSTTLRAAGIGSEVGQNQSNLWKCTKDDVKIAISQGLASPTDFIVVSGVSVWTKGPRGISRGIQAEVQNGKFEIVPPSVTHDVFDILRNQEVLTKLNLVQSLARSNMAWAKGSAKKEAPTTEKQVSMSGLGEGFDEDDDSVVFKSDVKVSDLSDTALRSWVATFLLGSPSLGI